MKVLLCLINQSNKNVLEKIKEKLSQYTDTFIFPELLHTSILGFDWKNECYTYSAFTNIFSRLDLLPFERIVLLSPVNFCDNKNIPYKFKIVNLNEDINTIINTIINT
ncbi:hypothetical protein CM19_08925 [Candidatus Acidianus copahuensis]|uniref:Uncharacterized protein n=1 Tax=Candidatus Acidianus copahuensis TaxID=1160895 RepID=A0A031LKN6_9CREN|nr:hypothetical protein [Candidatus Acidianus copahuensis]EZQ03893.1 hypothetical protein CM19_08925 [Candidatus Acidianus copahuensis]